ncbi:MAG: hypothetical protein ABR562_04540 [Thermoplasmatota archaeon]
MHRFAALAAALAVAGCISAPVHEEPAPVAADGFTHATFGDLHVAYAPGALSRLANEGASAVAVGVPQGTLLLQGSHWVPATTVQVPAGGNATVLPPPGESSFNVTVDGTAGQMRAPGTWQPFLDGAPVLD